MNEYLPTSTANCLPHNLQRGERLASIGAGLVLAGFGLARGGLPGACKAVAGGLLVSRGLSGHCHVKGLLNEPREELQLLREEVQQLTRRLQRLQERQRDDSRQDAALDAEPAVIAMGPAPGAGPIEERRARRWPAICS
ncbi:DUF2892 domain-containing protein [Pseudomonas aeruginosa]|uniref:YgaP family membrane protein n=1 Tax=Pseudomonas aeruginosa TaxID=287 RepID=UPI0019127A60|nr:DUF2892 domain-containing protein [Pseudomonas aeruginosa]